MGNSTSSLRTARKGNARKISSLISDFHSAKEGCHAVTHSSLYLLTVWDDSLNPCGNNQ